MSPTDNQDKPDTARLALTAHQSPYCRLGAPGLDQRQDPYGPLRAKALAKLEAMGFEPESMVEHAVLWAEHQDPWGHVAYAQYLHFFGPTWNRFMDGYGSWLTKKEMDGVIGGKTVAPMAQRFKLDIKRQVKFPDALISAYRQERIEPTRNGGPSVLYSLVQQAIVAEVDGNTTFVDVKSGRPVDIRTLGGNFPALYEGLLKKQERALALKAKWEKEHPPKSSGKPKL